MITIHPLHCERCGEELTEDSAIWLELSMDDGKYYRPDEFPKRHGNQGGFPFGRHCSRKVLKVEAGH